MKLTANSYLEIKRTLIEEGYADEIDWQTNIQPCDNSYTFLNETVWVILNSGMREQIARIISNRIKEAWANGKPTSSAFGHNGKVAAIDYVREKCGTLFLGYLESHNKIEFLKTIPFIGPITCYHIAKNLGHDVVKPDRHLVRIANKNGYPNCNEMCIELSKLTGDKVSVIDIVLWRAANLGMI